MHPPGGETWATVEAGPSDTNGLKR
jgi:hypothetical protein